MNKSTFIYMLIEAVLLLIPIATLFIKLGGALKTIETLEKRTEDIPEWRSSIDTKVAQLELNDIAQNTTLNEINKNITAISTKMDLLLDSKIKLRGVND